MSDEKDEGPRSNKVEREELKAVKHDVELAVLEPVPALELVEEKFEPIPLTEEDEQTLSVSEELDNALDEVAAALEKLGVSEKSIALALGLGTRADRNARKANRQSKRDKLKANNGQGQNKRTVKVDTPK